jgi:O-antigen/teichoic acid export membrane protein
MRDTKREQWKSDPDRTIVQSDAVNRAALIWSITSPLVVLCLVLLFVPDWDWRALTGLMMFAFASGSVVLILGWVYELFKYRERRKSN